VIQREIRVQNIDYDPEAAEDSRFRHGFVDQAAFNQALLRSIRDSQTILLGHRNIAQNVIRAVTGDGRLYSHGDIEDLTRAIATDIGAEYGTQGRPVAGALVGTLTDLVRTALVENLQIDRLRPLVREEESGFDSLLRAANAVPSRRKGTPNTIPYANLPRAIRERLDRVLGDIRTERARWTAAAITPEYAAPKYFATEVLQRQRSKHYQGNHTNMAGWLPAVAAPVDLISRAAENVYRHASPRLQRMLKRPDPAAALADPVVRGHVYPNQFRTECTALLAQEMVGINDAAVKLSAMAALCQGVSAYIEFNIPGGISRVLYEPVNNRIYLSAHYKWHRGYNPFFEVTAFPAV
jgi:hypothetical protein